jgi:protein-S-isoprenylcysteine O-methyltransferase Ste14
VWIYFKKFSCTFLPPLNSHLLALKIINGCWILFAVIWMVAALWTKQSVYQQRLGLLRYSLPLIVGVYLIFKGSRFSDPLGLRVIPFVDAIAWTGVVLCIGGLAFCVWARVTLGRNWSGVVTFKGGHELITRGPYAIVRHPIYTGILIMLVGTIIVLGHVAGIIGLPLVFWSFWIKLRYEERLMSEKFPEQYAAYQQLTKCIIPFVL